MQIHPLILIVGGLAVMFFGYFFGLFEGRGQGYKRRKAEEAAEEKQEVLERAVSPAMQPEPPAPVAPVAAPPADDSGILRIKDEGGRFQVELDGVRIHAENISVVKRKRLIEVVTRLRPWIDARPASNAPASAASPAPQVPAPVAPVKPLPRSEPISPVVAAAQSDEVPSVRSMVVQIDEILQKKIAGTSLANRGIRLMDAPGGGVTVFLGLDRYSSVGDVTDPEAQAAIRAAIAAWEKKYTPGV